MSRSRVIALMAAAVCAVGMFQTVAAGHPSSKGPQVVGASRTFGSGGWSWFADPRALYVDGRTFVGSVDQNRYVTIATIQDGVLKRVRIARESKEDDHGNPALLLQPDGRITAYYSDHGGPAMRFRTTLQAGDIDSWGPEQTLPDNTPGSKGFTYPNPVYLSAEDRTYLFWRGGNWGMTYARTGPNGFSHARTMFARSGERPYTKVASNNRDEIYLAFTNGHPREVSTSIFFAVYRHGALFRADGSRIGSTKDLPLRPSQADHVYMADRHGGVRAWIHDVAMGVDGRPVVVYATFRDQGRKHRYEYARWNGHSWVIHKIADAGGSIAPTSREHLYSGGVVLDHNDPRVVYASVPAGSHHEIARFVTTDFGASWKRKWITRNSSTENVRPVVPRGLPAGKRAVLWMRGNYVAYTDFRTSVVGVGRRR